jgi:hypothetical protein
MSLPQILALSALAAVCLVVYGRPLLNKVSLPKFSAPSQTLLDHVQAVIAVREAYPTPEIKQACNELLGALLEVDQ